MVSPRPYRKQLSLQEAIDELKRCSGTQFDPDIVDAFVKVIQKNDVKPGEYSKDNGNIKDKKGAD
jgi:HD-GYP domain-containing protein (c-di-GMP phosphodiesterase class II)